MPASPYVEQVVLLGDRRKFPLALVVPSFQAYKTAFPGRPISESDMEELEEDPDLQSLMDEEVLSTGFVLCPPRAPEAHPPDGQSVYRRGG